MQLYQETNLISEQQQEYKCTLQNVENLRRIEKSLSHVTSHLEDGFSQKLNAISEILKEYINTVQLKGTCLSSLGIIFIFLKTKTKQNLSKNR